MINLIIIDDEETTRESLVELIPWHELGVNAVKSASNGLEALELALDFEPSIILSDIRMPKMDGIELVKRVRQIYPDCEVIFLSGYSDKEYLKSAIHLNAVDYLEKPIDIEDLKSLFIKVVKKLEENRSTAAEAKRIRCSFYENMYLLRQEIVSKLILDMEDPFSLLNKYGAEVFGLSLTRSLAVVSFRFNWFSTVVEDNKSSLKSSFLKLLNSSEISDKMRFLSGFLNDNYLILIIEDNCYKESNYIKFAGDLIDLFLEHSSGKFSVSAAYSSPAENSGLLSEAYKSTLEVLQRQFYQGTGKLLHSCKVSTSSYEINKSIFTRFKKMLRDNLLNDAENLIKNLTEDISRRHDPDIGKIKNIYFNFIRILLETAMQWDVLQPGEDNENKYIWQEVDSQVTLQGLSSLLISNLETIFRKPDDKETSTKKLSEIRRYILDNYTDNQMSIQSVASHMFLSQSYLCAFFKKFSGKTLNEFITELRVEKAKEMLKDNRNKLYEITSSVGFSDVNYFSTLFKRYTGFSPSEFREKSLYDKKTN